MLTKTSRKHRKLPKPRRQYYPIYGLDGGLDYSKPSTMIGETFTPRCSEVVFREKNVRKATGVSYFAGTDTVPLLDDVMHIDQYYKSTGTDKLIAHTETNLYAYNSTTSLFECITPGEVVENCEDVWSLPTDSYTKLLIDFDGADGATTHTATTGQTVTFVGTAQLDTAQYKFATASLLLDGNSDYVTVPDNANWNFGTGNFTLNSHIRFNSLTGAQDIIGQFAAGGSYWVLYKAATTHKLNALFVSGGVTKGAYVMTSDWAASADTWYHIEFSRNSTTALLLIDGVAQTLTESTAFGTNDVGDVAGVLGVGYAGYVGYFNGWIDEVRVSKGIVRHTAAFTPPTSAYTIYWNTSAVDTDSRKGTYSVKTTIDPLFTTGVAAYEDFTADDFSAYTHLHFFIKSDIATAANDLQIILGDTTAGGTPVGGSDSGRFNVPALTAGVWKEVSIAITTPGDLGTVESVALYVKVDNGAQVVHIDDIMVTTETTGDEDNTFCSEIMNDYYVYSNGIQPIKYWDMSTATTTTLLGGATTACKAIAKLGERLCFYHVIENGTAYTQRVKWTVAGGLSTTPVATDWSDTGSGNTDLESTMGSDFIMSASKLGNYVIIYGERTILMQEYTGRVSSPFSFYTRVSGVGLAATRAIVNLGNEHIFLGFDDVYSYKGGREAPSIGDNVSTELFDIINPQYIGRSFMIYLEETYEIRLYFPLVGSTLPDAYFSYHLGTKSWSRGSRSYTGFGYYKKITADTWHSFAVGVSWDEVTGRYNDVVYEALAPINLYGDSAGVVYADDESTYDNVGAAIDGWWETKDFVTGTGYRRSITNWMELNFEATGHNVDISYSTDFGVTWSTAVTQALTNVWTQYNYDFEANAPQIRFKFRNATQGETFELRAVEVGYIDGSDRGTE